MDIEKILKSVPETRKKTPFVYAIVLFMLGLLFTAYEVYYEFVVLGNSLDMELLIYILIFIGLFLFMSIILVLLFLPMIRRAKAGLVRAEGMWDRISKLNFDKQRKIEGELQNLSKTWHSKTYITAQVPTEAVFGEHCLYAKVASTKTFGINQHIILPYENLSKIIVNETKGKNKEVALNAINALSVVGGVLSTISGNFGIFVFMEKRPTIVIIDDFGDTYQIDCKDHQQFIDNLLTKINKG